jgi:hypothetical protein
MIEKEQILKFVENSLSNINVVYIEIDKPLMLENVADYLNSENHIIILTRDIFNKYSDIQNRYDFSEQLPETNIDEYVLFVDEDGDYSLKKFLNFDIADKEFAEGYSIYTQEFFYKLSIESINYYILNERETSNMYWEIGTCLLLEFLNKSINKENDNFSLSRYISELKNEKKEIIREHISCTCDQAYKTRGLTDPGCFLCEYEQEIEIIMKEYLQLPISEARLQELHRIAKEYCYTTQDNQPTISLKGVELLLTEYSKGK